MRAAPLGYGARRVVEGVGCARATVLVQGLARPARRLGKGVTLTPGDHHNAPSLCQYFHSDLVTSYSPAQRDVTPKIIRAVENMKIEMS